MSNTTKPICNFRIVALKMEKCDSSIMQKSLWGREEWIYFYKGFNIDTSGDSCVIEKGAFDDCQLYNTEYQTVSISAIVGKNGSGKSTIMDMMLRIMNNVAASIIGEEYVYPAAEHLHYIDNVYASLAAYIDEAIVIITCKGRELLVKKLLGKTSDYYGEYKVDDNETEELLSSDESDINKPIQNNESLRNLLQSLFYTAIFNYSLYAYNYNDYLTEKTPNARLKELAEHNPLKDSKEEDSYWLKGVFHKNDGYQTPIVINPMRSDGMMNVPKENRLAKERMLSLVFYQDANTFPFRIINDKLKIVGLRLKTKDSKSYNKDYTLKKLGIHYDEPLAEMYDEKVELILRLWQDLYFPFEIDSLNYEQSTRNYIVYKTIKIACQYKKYENAYKWLNDTKDNEDKIREYLDELFHDHSHITTKLRRAINYLKWYKSEYLYDYGINNVDDLFGHTNTISEIALDKDDFGTMAVIVLFFAIIKDRISKRKFLDKLKAALAEWQNNNSTLT